jgi:hypothetical protein
MCLIVDTNRIADLLRPSQDMTLLRHAVVGKRQQSRLVLGGRLLEEYWRLQQYRTIFQELERAGRLRRVDSVQVNAEEKRIVASALCRSDDAHVLALARISGARLLCSEDGDLCTDFRSKSLIDQPRGKIYASKHHSTLLSRHCKIAGSRRRRKGAKSK